MAMNDMSHTVLIIDDDAPTLKALISYLQGLGFKPLIARTGERGLDVARRSKPDIILLDVMMPGLDGFETCRRLKADPKLKDIPIIFLTALTNTTDKIKGFEAGAVDYITKPIQNQEVSARIHTHLRLHELTERLEQKVQEQTQELTIAIEEARQLNRQLQQANDELAREIAEREQAENSLQESEERYRRLAENAKDMIYRMSLPDGQYEYVSPASHNITGYNPDEFYNSPKLVTEIIHADWREYFATEWAKLIKGEMAPFYEYQIIHKSGKARWLHQRNVLVWNDQGQPLAIEGIVTDITALKQTEAEIRRHNRELTLLNRVIAATATGPNTVAILDAVCRELALAFDTPQTTATLLNQDQSLVTVVAGYRAKGQPTLLNENIPVENNPLVQYFLTHKTPLVAEDVQSDSPLASVRDLLRQHNIVSLLVLPLIVEQEVIGSLNIGTIEPRSFSDEEVGLAQRVAEQVTGALVRVRLDEQHRQLEDQLRQSQKMEAIGRLAGGMAHDFNNLLTVITGYSELLLKRHMDNNDPQYRDVEQIHKAGERASTLTRHLLAFSRQQVIQPEVLDLNIIITDLNKMLRRLVSEDIDLITNLDPSSGHIKADSGQIEQIIMNLVVNACDAMPQGGKLTIETTKVNVDEEYARRHIGLEPGAYVMLTISDTGAGMDAETLSHIFEPFYTTKKKGKGTGLGLATVYGIVQQNEGYILVSSQPGQGTRFQIYLPCFEQTTAFTHREQTPAESPAGTETILLVEDEDMVRELARQVLLQNGYQILEARNGQDALKVCEQCNEPIHLLLTDVVMPGGLNGRDLAQQLIALHPEIKVLYMSGYVDDAIAQYGILDSGTTFLQKPFSPVALSLKVREILDA
jgi:PAS domain S-box-containing protein